MNTINTADLKSLQEKHSDLTLVNTLKPDHFEKTKIPSSINIPLEDKDFVSRVEKEAGAKDKPVVVYCANQKCDSSEKAAHQLRSAGFTAVSRYTGGAEEWQQDCEKQVSTNQSC